MGTVEESSDVPLVAVLMATHNGADFLEQQVRSILAQQGVRVHLIVSDDASTDGTLELLRELAADDRISLLQDGRFGSPQANFLRLIREADVAGAAAVALADQDDIWHDDKLARQLGQLRRLRVDAVSSNVTAFWERADGSRRTELIDKAQPQVPLDFLLESGGPGCTFLVGADAYARVRRVVDRLTDDGRAPHDWLVYAIVRATGGRWHIDPAPTIDYRQHAANATGANSGIAPTLVRVRRLRAGDYRAQCAAVARLSATIADGDQRLRLERIAPLFQRSDFGSRVALARLAPELRRDRREQLLLRTALLLGLW